VLGAGDILSLNVLVGNLVKNPLVARAIYSVDSRILAEAGSLDQSLGEVSIQRP
jgi:membrane protein